MTPLNASSMTTRNWNSERENDLEQRMWNRRIYLNSRISSNLSVILILISEPLWMWQIANMLLDRSHRVKSTSTLLAKRVFLVTIDDTYVIQQQQIRIESISKQNRERTALFYFFFSHLIHFDFSFDFQSSVKRNIDYNFYVRIIFV